MASELAGDAFLAFASDLAAPPAITLRAGNEVDEYRAPTEFDAVLDSVTDEYFQQYFFGLYYLDARSWRYYLPHLIEYTLRQRRADNVTDAFLWNLRPPDRNPPRLASLSPPQEAVVVRFLDHLAFAEESEHGDAARLALEEWWAPGALYRPART